MVLPHQETPVLLVDRHDKRFFCSSSCSSSSRIGLVRKVHKSVTSLDINCNLADGHQKSTEPSWLCRAVAYTTNARFYMASAAALLRFLMETDASREAEKAHHTE